jgi:hypothetical protein
MRFFKLAVISLVIIFFLFTFIGLLLPSSVTVTRKQAINAVADSVRFYTNNIYHWKYWLNGIDTNYQESSVGISGKNSKIKLGAYIITVTENNLDYITTSWHGKGAKDQVCRIHLNYSAPNETIVFLSFQQHLSWLPWDRLGGMLHDEVIGPSMQASLDKLKQVVEKSSD